MGIYRALLHFRSCRRWRWRDFLFFSGPGENMWMVFLDRTEARTGCRRSDIVGKGNATLDATFAPGFLLTTEIALDPGDGDAGPDGGPCEWKGPAQLILLAWKSGVGIGSEGLQ